MVFVGTNRLSVLDEHRRQDRAGLRQRRITRTGAADTLERHPVGGDHLARLRVAVQEVLRLRAQRSHVQLRLVDELLVRRGTRVNDLRVPVATHEQHERAENEHCRYKSRCRSDAGLHRFQCRRRGMRHSITRSGIHSCG